MKLLVIVLCLACERFLTHKSAYSRFSWLDSYLKNVLGRLSQVGPLNNPWLQLFLSLLPILLSTAVVYFLFGSFLFGFLGLLLNLLIFYYCLGPENPFYPEQSSLTHKSEQDGVGVYLSNVNGQLFSVIFWYVLLGPIGLLAYRLIALTRSNKSLAVEATWLTDVLEWIPAKMTSLLYLLVGNFQAGVSYFIKHFFTPPQENQLMLSTCGLQAVDYDQKEQQLFPQAETLVEHAVIVLLVLLAFFTMVAWL